MDPAYYFYDLNGKVNWKVSPKDRVYVSAFSGFDDFGVSTSNSSSFEGTTEQEDISFGLDWKTKSKPFAGTTNWAHGCFPTCP